MTDNQPTNVRLAGVDKDNLRKLVEHNVFTNMADAHRGAIRRGIKDIMQEYGIG